MPFASDLDIIIDQALTEDRVLDDITTKSFGYGIFKVDARIVAKEVGICAGIDIVKEVFKAIGGLKVQCIGKVRDGAQFKKGNVLLYLRGPAKFILVGERIALNLLSRLSGIATTTKAFVDRAKPYRVKILDTRKTTPGFRMLEKYAVRMGGGYNHRFNLSEAVLIKDNHIACMKKLVKGTPLSIVVSRVKRKLKNKLVEIEVNTVREFRDALRGSPDIIMLDNMTIAKIKECVKIRNKYKKSTRLEVSGGVRLANIKQLAKTGVDRISIGALTHSPKAIDFSLEII